MDNSTVPEWVKEGTVCTVNKSLDPHIYKYIAAPDSYDGESVILTGRYELDAAQQVMEIQTKTSAGWWFPLQCLVPIDKSASVIAKELTECEFDINYESTPVLTSTNKTTKTEQKDKTMVYRVTAIKTPSVIAQQNGATESVILDNVTVVASDVTGAALLAGAQNADKLSQKALEGGTIRTVVAQV